MTPPTPFSRRSARSSATPQGQRRRPSGAQPRQFPGSRLQRQRPPPVPRHLLGRLPPQRQVGASLAERLLPPPPPLPQIPRSLARLRRRLPPRRQRRAVGRSEEPQVREPRRRPGGSSALQQLLPRPRRQRRLVAGCSDRRARQLRRRLGGSSALRQPPPRERRPRQPAVGCSGRPARRPALAALRRPHQRWERPQRRRLAVAASQRRTVVGARGATNANAVNCHLPSSLSTRAPSSVV